MIKEQLKTLSEMQEFDDKIGQYRVLQKELPKQLAKIIESVDAATSNLLTIESERAELNKAQRAVDSDIQQANTQIDKYAAQLSDIKTNKEYKALNSEIAYLNEKVSELENLQLELMEQEAEIKERIQEAKNGLAKAEDEKRSQEGALRDQIDKLESQIEETRAERNKLAVTLPTNIIRHYGNMIKNKGNLAVSFTKDGSCGACGFVIRPQIRIELQLFSRIIFCENCGRIMIDPALYDETVEE